MYYYCYISGKYLNLVAHRLEAKAIFIGFDGKNRYKKGEEYKIIVHVVKPWQIRLTSHTGRPETYESLLEMISDFKIIG